MDWTLIVVALVALAASSLTLFSGFGLATVLLPVFAWLFPLDTAVAAVALVHLGNNGWKAWLVGRPARWDIVLRFGLPAMLAAFLGAWLLLAMTEAGALARYELLGTHTITPAGLAIGTLIVAFAAFDLVPRLRAWEVRPKWLPAGGALSGFFGGLSGHQGALRSAFLGKLRLTPAVFVATGVWCAIIVDVARLGVYGANRLDPGAAWLEVGVATAAALIGALLGKRMLGKLTMEGIRTLVGVVMLVTGASIAAGWT